VSHHLDSPTSRRDPRLNLTDTYVFDGTEGTVFVMVLNTSLAGADRVPGFRPEGRYETKIHTDGSDTESLTYRFAFGEPGADGVQQLRGVADLRHRPGDPLVRSRVAPGS
jgi:hypothetical protein